MPKSLKQLEIALSHQTEAEWDAEYQLAQAARAAVQARHEAEFLVKFDAGLLMIGCDLPPRTRYVRSHATDREVWGVKVSTSIAQADRAYSIGEY